MNQEEIMELRSKIEESYKDKPTGCGSTFDELLCFELHEGGLTFLWLAEKWGMSVSTLGELIYDHCIKLEPCRQILEKRGK